MPKPRQQPPAEKAKTPKPAAKERAPQASEPAAQSRPALINDPGLASPEAVLQLQRQYGNRAVQRLIQRAPPAGDEVQREAPVGLAGGPVGGSLEHKIKSERGGGQPLDRSVGAKIGGALKADFSGVRVHTDARSDDLNRSLSARAFTLGSDVFFSKGAYNPGTHSGQKLLAHELTHVVQQGAAGRPAKHAANKVQAKLTVGPAADAHEAEADRVADQVVGQMAEPDVQRESAVGGPRIQRALMSAADFVTATSTRRRGGYIKLVDKALKLYEADKTPAKLTALRFTLEKYMATKGDGDTEKVNAARQLLAQVMGEEQDLGPESQLRGLLPYKDEITAMAEKGKTLKQLDGKLRGGDRFLRETLKSAIIQSDQDPDRIAQRVGALNLQGGATEEQKAAIGQLVTSLTQGRKAGNVALYHSLYARCMELASLMFSEHEHQNDFSATLGNNADLKDLVRPIIDVTRVFSEALDLSYARKLGQQRGMAQAEITTQDRASFEVAILGAGPVGMLAAIEAHMAGANVNVYEMRRTGPSRANVLKLTAASMHKLRRVGVYGDLFGPDSPKGSDSVQEGQAISVGLLEDVLRTKAAQLGIRVTYGYQVETITAPGQEGGRTIVRLKKYVPTRAGPEMDLYNKLKDQPDVIDARSDLVIGATGAGGSTRSKLGLESDRLEGEQGEEYIDFTAVGIFEGAGGQTAVPPKDKDREGAWVVGLRTPAVDYLLTQITRDQFIKFKDSTGTRNTWVRERGRTLAGYTGDLKQSSVFDITLNQARTFVNKEASGVVIGDEAATPHPLTGSGFNTGASSTNLVPGLVRGLGKGQKDEAFQKYSGGVKSRTDLMVGKGSKFFEKNIGQLTKMNKLPEPVEDEAPQRRGYTPEDIGVTPETSLQYELAQKRVMAQLGMETGLNRGNLEEYGPDYDDPEAAYKAAQRRIEALFNIPSIKEDK